MFNIDIMLHPSYFYVIEILLLIQCIHTIFYISREISPFFFLITIPLSLYNLYGLISVITTTTDKQFRYVLTYFYGGLYVAMTILFLHQVISNVLDTKSRNIVCKEDEDIEDKDEDEYEYIEEYEECEDEYEEEDDYVSIPEDKDKVTSSHKDRIISTTNYIGNKFEGL